jgi:hypothetical protein
MIVITKKSSFELNRSIASRPPPAGSSQRCISLPNLRFVAGSVYDIVVSDDSMFNGVLPLDVLKGFALEHAKQAGINATDIAKLLSEPAPDAPPPTAAVLAAAGTRRRILQHL